MRMNINNVDTSMTAPEFKVGFFGIQPGERAIVRFLVDSDADFDVITLHNLETAEGKPIKVDCIRDPHEAVSVCPLCANEVKIDQRVYLRMLQYEQAPDGSFIPKAKIWDRSVRSDIITSLKTYLNDYGPLSDIICSITRTGSGLDTVYTVSPNLPGKEKYPLDVSAFEDYDVVGTVVRSWDANQMNEFLVTREIPAKPQAQQTAQQQGFNPVPPVAGETTPFDETSAPAPSVATPNTAAATERPRRVYN